MRLAPLALLAFLAAARVAGAVGPNNALNDTGITLFGDDTQNTLTSEPATHPGQDASQGRDALARAGTLVKTGGGVAGFDFTKIANNGAVLASNVALGLGVADWGCTFDNVTGLMWEIKVNSPGHLRHHTYTFSWYDSNGATNGGNPGQQNNGTCAVAGRCDTEKYAADVNAAGMCGHNDWRMPSIVELNSLVDYSLVVTPAIDAAYFPNTIASAWWSSSISANFAAANAWTLSFYYGTVSPFTKTGGGPVRLVRAGK